MKPHEFIIISQGDAAGLGWHLWKKILKKPADFFSASQIQNFRNIITVGFLFENDGPFIHKNFLVVETPPDLKLGAYRKWRAQFKSVLFDSRRKKPVFLSLRKERAYIPGKEDALIALKSYRAFILSLRLWDILPVSSLVTLPVSKEMIMKAGISFSGHTRVIEEFTGHRAFMCMYHPTLSVMVLTEHIPLASVSEKIYQTDFNSLEKALFFFRNLFHPKKNFAMTGLNPHAGEHGRIGDEEKFLEYHLKNLQKAGIEIDGLFPADGIFGRDQRKNYSLVVAQYHDQGLIPFKALAGLSGLNITLNQPRLRVSPDHGTAYSMVEKDLGNPVSIIKAVQFAMRYNQKWIHTYSSL